MMNNFLVKKLIKSKLKGLPQDQQDMIVELVTKNPALFQEIGEKIQQKTKSGMNQQAAMMQVMREYKPQLEKIMKDKKGAGGDQKKDAKAIDMKNGEEPKKKRGLFGLGRKSA